LSIGGEGRNARKDYLLKDGAEPEPNGKAGHNDLFLNLGIVVVVLLTLGE
jgi:hypothetical protein